MSNFLNLPIEHVTEAFDPFGDSHPEGPCGLIDCRHGRVFTKGQPFVRFERSFVHIECLDDTVKHLAPVDFLMLLAAHVAIAPSRHNAGTIRQVITGLRRALGAAHLELEQAKAGGSVDLPIDVASAIAAGEDEGE